MGRQGVKIRTYPMMMGYNGVLADLEWVGSYPSLGNGEKRVLLRAPVVECPGRADWKTDAGSGQICLCGDSG